MNDGIGSGASLSNASSSSRRSARPRSPGRARRAFVAGRSCPEVDGAAFGPCRRIPPASGFRFMDRLRVLRPGKRSPTPGRAVERAIDKSFRHKGKSFGVTHTFLRPDAGGRISATVKWNYPAKAYGFLVPQDGSPDINCRNFALAAVGLDTAFRRSDGRLRVGSGATRARGLAASCRRFINGIAPDGIFRPRTRKRSHDRRSRSRAPNHGTGDMVHADGGLRLPGARRRLPRCVLPPRRRRGVRPGHAAPWLRRDLS